jgi:lipopolysaccharide transport system permease protein
MTPIVESFRYGFLGAGMVSVSHLLYSAGFMGVALTLGMLLFNQVERTFMDTV